MRCPSPEFRISAFNVSQPFPMLSFCANIEGFLCIIKVEYLSIIQKNSHISSYFANPSGFAGVVLQNNAKSNPDRLVGVMSDGIICFLLY